MPENAAGAPGDILQVMESHHRRLLQLCDRLERVADGLPDDVDVKLCLRLARTLPDILEASHRFEEEVFFPRMRALYDADLLVASNLARLRGEHREDQSFGTEVAEVLLDWGLCAGQHDAEATGYMLRGFFESMRRHVAFEQAYLVASYRAHVNALAAGTASENGAPPANGSAEDGGPSAT